MLVKFESPLELRKELLIKSAIDARNTAFSPISNSQVGAAVLVYYDGRFANKNESLYLTQIFSGSNMEFARSQNIHAEWIAMSEALKYLTKKSFPLNTYDANGVKIKMREGLEDIVAIAIVNNAGIPGCGSCRQMLYEINPDMQVLGVLPSGEVKVDKQLRELYPNAYRSNSGLVI